MAEEIDSYLATIEEYVFDEKKIVTCSWLSRVLGIHNNLSKQLLHTFYERSSKKDELSLTYLLIGSPDDDGKIQVSIVKDKALEKCESSWKVITSKHVYSVQRCPELVDLNVLYTAQLGEPDEILPKGIAIDFDCKQRDSSLLAKLRSDALPKLPKQPLGIGKKAAPQPTKDAKSKSPAKSKEDKSTEENKGGSKDKGSNFPSMFKNNKPADSKSASSNKAAEKPKANNKKPQGIGAFFSKATSKPSSETEKKDESKKPTIKEESNSTEGHSPSKENKPTLNIVKEDKDVQKDTVKEEAKKSEPAKKSSPKNKKTAAKPKVSTKKVNSKKRAGKQEQKKRKRLVVASDSESEHSSEGEQEEERELTPEPQPAAVVEDDDDDIVSATPEPATRKRKRKLINKTYKTPDGYMMTKKEYVSCSEEEEESVPEKKVKGNSHEEDSSKESGNLKSDAPVKPSTVNKNVPKATKVSPQKTKQASLTSFFKKK